MQIQVHKKGIGNSTLLFVVGIILGVLILLMAFKIIFSFLHSEPTTTEDLSFLSSIVEEMNTAKDIYFESVYGRSIVEHKLREKSFVYLAKYPNERKYALCYCPKFIGTESLNTLDCAKEVRISCYDLDYNNVAIFYYGEEYYVNGRDLVKAKNLSKVEPRFTPTFTYLVMPKTLFLLVPFEKENAREGKEFAKIKNFAESLVDLEDSLSRQKPHKVLINFPNSDYAFYESSNLTFFKDGKRCGLNITFILNKVDILLGPFDGIENLSIVPSKKTYSCNNLKDGEKISSKFNSLSWISFDISFTNNTLLRNVVVDYSEKNSSESIPPIQNNKQHLKIVNPEIPTIPRHSMP